MFLNNVFRNSAICTETIIFLDWNFFRSVRTEFSHTASLLCSSMTGWVAFTDARNGWRELPNWFVDRAEVASLRSAEIAERSSASSVGARTGEKSEWASIDTTVRHARYYDDRNLTHPPCPREQLSNPMRELLRMFRCFPSSEGLSDLRMRCVASNMTRAKPRTGKSRPLFLWLRLLSRPRYVRRRESEANMFSVNSSMCLC